MRYCWYRLLWHFLIVSLYKNVPCSKFISVSPPQTLCSVWESDGLTLLPFSSQRTRSFLLFSPLFNRVLASRYRRSPLCPRPTLLSIKTQIAPRHAHLVPSGPAPLGRPTRYWSAAVCRGLLAGTKILNIERKTGDTLGSVGVWSLFRGGRERGGLV